MFLDNSEELRTDDPDEITRITLRVNVSSPLDDILKSLEAAHRDISKIEKLILNLSKCAHTYIKTLEDIHKRIVLILETLKEQQHNQKSITFLILNNFSDLTKNEIHIKTELHQALFPLLNKIKDIENGVIAQKKFQSGLAPRIYKVFNHAENLVFRRRTFLLKATEDLEDAIQSREHAKTMLTSTGTTVALPDKTGARVEALQRAAVRSHFFFKLHHGALKSFQTALRHYDEAQDHLKLQFLTSFSGVCHLLGIELGKPLIDLLYTCTHSLLSTVECYHTIYTDLLQNFQNSFNQLNESTNNNFVLMNVPDINNKLDTTTEDITLHEIGMILDIIKLKSSALGRYSTALSTVVKWFFTGEIHSMACFDTFFAKSRLNCSAAPPPLFKTIIETFRDAQKEHSAFITQMTSKLTDSINKSQKNSSTHRHSQCKLALVGEVTDLQVGDNQHYSLPIVKNNDDPDLMKLELHIPYNNNNTTSNNNYNEILQLLILLRDITSDFYTSCQTLFHSKSCIIKEALYQINVSPYVIETPLQRWIIQRFEGSIILPETTVETTPLLFDVNEFSSFINNSYCLHSRNFSDISSLISSSVSDTMIPCELSQTPKELLTAELPSNNTTSLRDDNNVKDDDDNESNVPDEHFISNSSNTAHLRSTCLKSSLLQLTTGITLVGIKLLPSDRIPPKSFLIELENDTLKFVGTALIDYSDPNSKFSCHVGEHVHVLIPVGSLWTGRDARFNCGKFPPSIIEHSGNPIWTAPKFTSDKTEQTETKMSLKLNDTSITKPTTTRPPHPTSFSKDLNSPQTCIVNTTTANTSPLNIKSPMTTTVTDDVIRRRCESVPKNIVQATITTSPRITSRKRNVNKNKTTTLDESVTTDTLSTKNEQQRQLVEHTTTPAAAISLKPKHPSRYPLNKPEALDSQLDEFRERFHLPEAEELLQWYSCALSLRILLHGRLYVSTNYISFFSLFNDATIFGAAPTVVIIPFNGITAITKRNSAFVFPNAIEIERSDGTTHFFASFLLRDKVYDFLISRWNNPQCIGDPGLSPSIGSSIPPSPISSSVQKTRKITFPFFTAPMNAVPFPSVSLKNFPTTQLSKVQPCAVWRKKLEDIFYYLFGDNGSEDAETSFFWKRYLEFFGAELQSHQPWTEPIKLEHPILPDNNNNTRSIPSKKLQYFRPIKPEGLAVLLRLPERAKVDEVWYLYVYAPTCIIVESHINLEGIPFSDSFSVIIRYRLTQVASSETQFDAEFDVHWKQAPLLKSRIERETLQDVSAQCLEFTKYATKSLNPSGAPVVVEVPSSSIPSTPILCSPLSSDFKSNVTPKNQHLLHQAAVFSMDFIKTLASYCTHIVSSFLEDTKHLFSLIVIFLWLFLLYRHIEKLEFRIKMLEERNSYL